MSYDNRNSGLLFKNDRKEKDTHPDYSGHWVDENNQEFWLSAWIKKDKNGKPFMSLARGKMKEQQQPRDYAASNNQPGPNDDIPF